MNYLLLFPLGILLTITLFTVAFTGTTLIGTMDDDANFSSGEGVTINGTDSGVVEIPQVPNQKFDMWGLKGALVILAIALVLGAFISINVVGSGLGDEGVQMVFNATVYLGLWACLTVMALSMLMTPEIVFLFWVVLTFMYVIGVAMEVNSTGA